MFQDLSFEIPAGRSVALLGPSGIGKTSLLRLIAGLAPPDAGSITASDGQPLSGRIATMSQQDLLLPWAKVIDNVMLGATLRGQKQDSTRARDLLDRVGLGEVAGALPHELSGGMRSRVAIARTLYEDRPVMLLDEPFAALDTITKTRLQALIGQLLAGRTCLFITHDPLEACRLGHHLMVLAGNPARLGPAITVPGTPPRAVDDPAVMQTQARLLAALAE